MLTEFIKQLMERKNLSSDECEVATNALFSSASPEQIAAFLVLLRAKPETADELYGIVKCLQKHMIRVSTSVPTLDIVGTGGDFAQTVNISTGASFVAASCGVNIVKHGNRSVSSRCGSADVLEALGVNIDLTPAQVEECLAKLGIGFCFAPNFHPILPRIGAVRRALKVPTTFNLLGPLLNPAQVKYAIIGVFSPTLLPVFAEVVKKLQLERALIVHSKGLDELSSCAPAHVIEINYDQQRNYTIDPQQLGFASCTTDDLRGGDAEYNAKKLQQVFSGEIGPISDTIILNAAAAVYIYQKSTSFEEAIVQVQKTLQSGKTQQLLNDFIHLTQSFSV